MSEPIWDELQASCENHPDGPRPDTMCKSCGAEGPTTQPATEDATARTSPGEGAGTGSGPGEAHGAAEGSTVDAAIEAAAHALFDAIRVDYEPGWDQAGAKTREQCCELGDAAVRAAEPILRQAVAEEIARALEAKAAPKVNPRYQETWLLRPEHAAEIAREVGRG